MLQSDGGLYWLGCPFSLIVPLDRIRGTSEGHMLSDTDLWHLGGTHVVRHGSVASLRDTCFPTQIRGISEGHLSDTDHDVCEQGLRDL